MHRLPSLVLLALLLAACQVVVGDPDVAAPADGEGLTVSLDILEGPAGGTLALIAERFALEQGRRPG